VFFFFFFITYIDTIIQIVGIIYKVVRVSGRKHFHVRYINWS